MADADYFLSMGNYEGQEKGIDIASLIKSDKIFYTIKYIKYTRRLNARY